MGKLSLKNMANDVKSAMVKNAPGILVGVGIVGMAGTSITSVNSKNRFTERGVDCINSMNKIIELKKKGEE